jgi:hypothetical protein
VGVVGDEFLGPVTAVERVEAGEADALELEQVAGPVL